MTTGSNNGNNAPEGEEGGAGETSAIGGSDNDAATAVTSSAPKSGAAVDDDGGNTPAATSSSSFSLLPMIAGVVVGTLVLIVLLVFAWKKCSDRNKLARLKRLGGMNGPSIMTNQAYEHGTVAAAAAAGGGIPDDNNTYDMAPPGQRSATLNNRGTNANGNLPDDNNTYDMAPPGQRSATLNNRSTSANGRGSTLSVQLMPNVMYGGSADVRPRNATLFLNRAAAPPSSASQEQYAVIADGSSGPPEGTVVYNAGGGDGGDGGGGPMYATPTPLSAGASGGNEQYDGWTVNEAYAAVDATTASTPTYAVYAGGNTGGGGGGGMYATVDKGRQMRPRSNSLYSLSGEAQRDRSGTLQLAAAQQGVVYNVPMEEGDDANSSNI